MFNSLVIWIWSADLSLSLGMPGQPNHSRSFGSESDDMPVATPPTLSLYKNLPLCLDMLTGSLFEIITNLDIGIYLSYLNLILFL